MHLTSENHCIRNGAEAEVRFYQMARVLQIASARSMNYHASRHAIASRGDFSRSGIAEEAQPDRRGCSFRSLLPVYIYPSRGLNRRYERISYTRAIGREQNFPACSSAQKTRAERHPRCAHRHREPTRSNGDK